MKDIPPKENLRSNRLLYYFFTTVLASMAALILIRKIDLDKLIFEHFHSKWLFVVLLGICLSYAARVLFFQKSLKKIQISFPRLYLITALYSWISVVFPLGIGHLSFPLMLNKYVKAPFPVGIAALTAFNVVRVIILLVIFLSAFMMLDFNVPGTSLDISGNSIIIFIILTAIAASLLLLLNTDRLGNNKLSSFIKDVINSFFDIFSDEKWILLFALSLAAEVFNVVVFFASFSFVGFQLSPEQVFFFYAVANLSILLPVHSVGSLGSLEAILTLVLIGYGISTNSAIQVSFAIHLIQLISRTVIGLFSYIILVLIRSAHCER